jgi:hypothetical protein
MRELIINSIDALIPLGFAGLLLACPQTFVKKDLKAQENATTAKRLKTAGIALLIAGALILASNLMTG